jgi:hypothetical protein
MPRQTITRIPIAAPASTSAVAAEAYIAIIASASSD